MAICAIIVLAAKIRRQAVAMTPVLFPRAMVRGSLASAALVVCCITLMLLPPRIGLEFLPRRNHFSRKWRPSRLSTCLRGRQSYPMEYMEGWKLTTNFFRETPQFL